MAKELGVMSDWIDSYVDTIQDVYGSFDTPELSTAEVCEEWQRVFDPVMSEEADPFFGGVESYLQALEELYGEFELHPMLSIQEICEEWQRCFSKSGSISLNPDQVRGKPAAVREDYDKWPLSSAS